MPAPISDDAQNEASRSVVYAVRKGHPGVEGDLETCLMIAYAMRQYARHSASDRFGPEHEMTRAFLDVATNLAGPVGDETERLAMAAIDSQTPED
jgi:hypothetical protein